jgi:hypothetical protein
MGEVTHPVLKHLSLPAEIDQENLAVNTNSVAALWFQYYPDQLLIYPEDIFQLIETLVMRDADQTAHGKAFITKLLTLVLSPGYQDKHQIQLSQMSLLPAFQFLIESDICEPIISAFEATRLMGREIPAELQPTLGYLYRYAQSHGLDTDLFVNLGISEADTALPDSLKPARSIANLKINLDEYQAIYGDSNAAMQKYRYFKTSNENQLLHMVQQQAAKLKVGESDQFELIDRIEYLLMAAETTKNPRFIDLILEQLAKYISDVDLINDIARKVWRLGSVLNMDFSQPHRFNYLLRVIETTGNTTFIQVILDQLAADITEPAQIERVANCVAQVGILQRFDFQRYLLLPKEIDQPIYTKVAQYLVQQTQIKWRQIVNLEQYEMPANQLRAQLRELQYLHSQIVEIHNLTGKFSGLHNFMQRYQLDQIPDELLLDYAQRQYLIPV